MAQKPLTGLSLLMGRNVRSSAGQGGLASERLLPGRQHGLITRLLLTALLLVAVVPVSFALEKSRFAPNATDNKRVPPSPTAGCNEEMSRINRLAVLEKLTTRLENELAGSPNIVKDYSLRNKMGTFIAGSMDDDVPFVSLDRWCWADFYEAHRSLAKGDDSAAFQSASDWKVCLEATFPDRMDLARPYLSCFLTKP